VGTTDPEGTGGRDESAAGGSGFAGCCPQRTVVTLHGGCCSHGGAVPWRPRDVGTGPHFDRCACRGYGGVERQRLDVDPAGARQGLVACACTALARFA